MSPKGATDSPLRLLPSVDLVVRTVLERGCAAKAVQTQATRTQVARAARSAVERLRRLLAADPAAAAATGGNSLAGITAAASGGATAVPGTGASGAGLTRALLLELVAAETARILADGARPSLRRVINATGVVLHTNLGRARLAPEAVLAVVEAAGPVNLELSLDDGSRQSRQVHLRELLTALTGAQDALVVNNNAAAVWLALRGLARGRAAVISRGELVEIGESFRLPDIMAEAGVRLIEVGTTNRTTLEDYRRALAGRLQAGQAPAGAAPGKQAPAGGPPAGAADAAEIAAGAVAAVVLVHPSNYRIVGFSSRPARRDVAALAHEAGVPVLEDLGSGALLDLSPWGLPGEPTPRAALAEGVDLVTFSGDKLAGGPQAGVIAGRGELIGRLRTDPVLRCLRPDKLTLAALEATLRLYGQGAGRVPVLRALTEPAETVRRRAVRALRALQALRRGESRRGRSGPGEGSRGGNWGGGRGGSRGGVELSLVATTAAAGGGSLPAAELPTWAIAVRHPSLPPDELWRRLAAADPPVVARRHDDALLLDFRSVADEEVGPLARVLAGVLGGDPGWPTSGAGPTSSG